MAIVRKYDPKNNLFDKFISSLTPKKNKSLDGFVGGGGGGANFSVQPVKEIKTPKMLSEADYIKNALAGMDAYKPTGGGGGGGLNLGSLYSAYEQEADSKRQTLSSTIQRQRQDLLDSISRVREDIQKSKEMKQQEFQGTRADLEERAMMADRSNRISAAGRGLSGSGLQQLAQLQNMMASGREVSSVANRVRSEQDQLGQTLKRSEEDTSKGIQNLSEIERNQLNEIMAELTGRKVSAAEQDRASRAAAASSAAAQESAYRQMLAQTKQSAQDQYNTARATFLTTIDALKSGKMKDKDKAAAKESARAAYSSGLLGTGKESEKAYKALIAEIDKVKKK